MAKRLAMTPPFDMLRGLQKWYPIIADREWSWKYRTCGENTGSMMVMRYWFGRILVGWNLR
jgi:hypothetical protein